VESLILQEKIFSSVINCLSSFEINRWSKTIEKLRDRLFKFCRKAFIQQLPTNANLKRWGKSISDACNLCNAYQSNKHVLSNCSSPVALDRHSSRHNSILTLLANWLSRSLDSTVFTLCVDLTGDYNPIDMVFETLRPDIVIFNRKSVFILELTIAHETNLEAAESRKDSKYANLSTNLKDRLSHCTLYKQAISCKFLIWALFQIQLIFAINVN